MSVPARRPSALAKTLRKWRGFLLAVILPTLLAAVYFYGIAAGQYVSEARFLVRGSSSGGSSMGALGAALGGAGFKPVSEEAMAVRDYVNSEDAVREVRKSVNLVEIWRRPEADHLARLWVPNPSIEMLTRYYRMMVTSEFDTESSTVTLHIRSFRPEDSQAVAEALLRASENLVNGLSERQRGNTMQDAQREVEIAERRVASAMEALTTFRQEGRALDPTSEATANMTTVTQMEAALAQARAELREKSGFMRTDNPQVAVVRNRISALEGQIANERQRLTHGTQAAPTQLAGYERLMLEREFADKQLASAVGSLESARIDVARQQLYLARITQPQLAETALYPKAAYAVGSIFAVLCVVYGIASLIFAGFREHAA
ncbi:capsule biosynthesis protein [Roseomonas indoligenes]|uniref:capsule biosynthesis protein n=1 Tax=Roseomonas indoligenes TaxID=2820811 RepID=UPI0031598B9E